mgnify:CR=1 FL=1
MSAPNTGLHNHPAFLRMMFNFCRLHHSAACFGAVAWDNVDMFCKEAKRTMITVASICKRGYLRFAVLTGKCIIAFTIEIFSHHSCMRRVRLVFVCRLWQKGLAAFTAKTNRSSDYFQFLLHPKRESEWGLFYWSHLCPPPLRGWPLVLCLLPSLPRVTTGILPIRAEWSSYRYITI